MLSNVDDLIYAELLFEQQEVLDRSHPKYETAIRNIVSMLRSGKTIKQVKRYIDSLDINSDLENILYNHIETQADNISNSKPDLAKVMFAGYTLKELIDLRKNTTRSRLIKTMSQVNELLKEKKSLYGIIPNQTKKYKREIESFVRTQSKQAREYEYAKVELKYNQQIIGWVSLAILDNRTSSTCLYYHNEFYSIKDYPTRFDIPNPPPRHPNCRSILVPVYSNTDINHYRLQNVDEFLRQNENFAREILGKKKATIYLTGKTPIKKFIDGNRFLRNDEIMKKLKIKSKSKSRLREIGGSNM